MTEVRGPAGPGPGPGADEHPLAGPGDAIQPLAGDGAILFGAGTPVTGVGQFQATSYVQTPLDIYASDHHSGPKSYMLSSYDVAFDANGDKWVPGGSVLGLSSTDIGFATPAGGATTGIFGVLVAPVNLRNGGTTVAVQVDNAVFNEAKCWDNGVFGTVRAASKTALAATNILFRRKDG